MTRTRTYFALLSCIGLLSVKDPVVVVVNGFAGDLLKVAYTGEKPLLDIISEQLNYPADFIDLVLTNETEKLTEERLGDIVADSKDTLEMTAVRVDFSQLFEELSEIVPEKIGKRLVVCCRGLKVALDDDSDVGAGGLSMQHHVEKTREVLWAHLVISSTSGDNILTLYPHHFPTSIPTKELFRLCFKLYFDLFFDRFLPSSTFSECLWVPGALKFIDNTRASSGIRMSILSLPNYNRLGFIVRASDDQARTLKQFGAYLCENFM